MAEKTETYELELLTAIKEHKIRFFEHCFGFVSFAKSTAHIHKLHESDVIKSELSKNRVTAKNYMLNKWIDGDNATLQVAAYRLMSDSEEHQKLNQSYVDHTTKGDKVNNAFKIEIVDSTDEGD